ncbi:ADP-ribosylglycohydrolase family protein [Brachybacterium sp. EF45031]|nr:ADP-ribosylglycohydrolase family protein [Brachybacterium sillae]
MDVVVPPGDALRSVRGVRERAIGSALAAAVGDALGAPYEFLAPIPATDDVDMVGGGLLGWAEGEWTDDTALAVVVLRAAVDAPGRPLTDETVLDAIAAGWFTWSIGAADIGVLTSAVMRRSGELAAASGRAVPAATDLRCAAQEVHEQLDRSGGNGALLRVHAGVLPALAAEDDVLEESVLALCRLTHTDPEAQEACVLWGFAVREAILTGRLDVRSGLERLPEERRDVWCERLARAEASDPAELGRNGWVVRALQAAWSAIHRAGPVPEGRFAQRAWLVDVLDAAVRSGFDTDTVSCIAGSLAGAAVGPGAVPPEWRRDLHGWPGYDADDLVALVQRALPADAEDIPGRTSRTSPGGPESEEAGR